MTTLGELIGGLAAAVTRAGAMSDAASARIAAEYRSDPVLRSMSVPRSGVDGVEFRIVFAFADPAVAPWPAPAPGTGGGAPRPSFGRQGRIRGPERASPGPASGLCAGANWPTTSSNPRTGGRAVPPRRAVRRELETGDPGPCAPALTDALQGQAGQGAGRSGRCREPAIFCRFLFARGGRSGPSGAGCVLCFWRGRIGQGRRAPARPETLSALRGEYPRRASAAARGKAQRRDPPALYASPGPDLAASRNRRCVLVRTVPSVRTETTDRRARNLRPRGPPRPRICG